MSEGIRLGDAERAVLKRLVERGGLWSDKDRPLWDSRYWTRQVLCSLARKQLVLEHLQDGKYQVMDAGLVANGSTKDADTPAVLTLEDVHSLAARLQRHSVNKARR